MMTRSDVQELIRNAIDEVGRAVGQLLKAHAARLLMALECAEVPPSPLDVAAEEQQEQDRALDGAAAAPVQEILPPPTGPPPPQAPRPEPGPPPPGFAGALRFGGSDGRGVDAQGSARVVEAWRAEGQLAAAPPRSGPAGGTTEEWLAAAPRSGPGPLLLQEARAEPCEAQVCPSWRPRWWRVSNSYFVGSLPVVERAAFTSVRDAVGALNSGALPVDTRWLLVYSASSDGWWVVYQNGYRDAATRTFRHASALPSF